MEETDVTHELDEMLKDSDNEYNYSKTDQYHEELATHVQVDHNNTDTDTNSIIMNVKKKKDIHIAPSLSITHPQHSICTNSKTEEDMTKLRKEFGTFGDDFKKLVNIMTQLTGEINEIKEKITKLESDSERDDEYKEYIDRILSVNLDKIKMKLKKSLKKSLLDH